MVRYLLNLQMAKRNFEITDRMMELISEFMDVANSTIVSKRNNRSFSIVERIDKYTLRIKMESRSSIAYPTRSISSLTRVATQNEEFYNLVKDNLYNGLIFSATLISTEDAQIIQMDDTDIVSEIISIFFKPSLPKAQALTETTSSEIRRIIIDYKNKLQDL